MILSSLMFKLLHLLQIIDPSGNRVERLAIGWAVRGSNPSVGEIFRICRDQPPIKWIPGFTGGKTTGA